MKKRTKYEEALKVLKAAGKDTTELHFNRHYFCVLGMALGIRLEKIIESKRDMSLIKAEINKEPSLDILAECALYLYEYQLYLSWRISRAEVKALILAKSEKNIKGEI